jgi:hypothetical protein
MSQLYIYDKKPKKHFIKKSFSTLILIPIVVAVVILIAWLIIINTTSKRVNVAGPEKIVGSIKAVSYATQTIDEPTFTMKIPATWHQTAATNNTAEDTITWMDVSQSKDTRWLTVYIDKIPPSLAINNLLPITISGDSLKYGLLSDNCSNFTSHGLNAQTASASYQGINFICDIADIVGSVTGTGVAGSVNRAIITGPTRGTHSYFFEYVERSGEPDYSFFDNALTSFRAK